MAREQGAGNPFFGFKGLSDGRHIASRGCFRNGGELTLAIHDYD
jgi:hypothetical protein